MSASLVSLLDNYELAVRRDVVGQPNDWRDARQKLLDYIVELKPKPGFVSVPAKATPAQIIAVSNVVSPYTAELLYEKMLAVASTTEG